MVDPFLPPMLGITQQGSARLDLDQRDVAADARCRRPPDDMEDDLTVPHAAIVGEAIAAIKPSARRLICEAPSCDGSGKPRPFFHG